ncbi:hypothetical protein SLA2020_011860 [Shorea laevis]
MATRCLIVLAFVTLSFSSVDVALGARHLLQAIPDFPSVPSVPGLSFPPFNSYPEVRLPPLTPVSQIPIIPLGVPESSGSTLLTPILPFLTPPITP